MYRLIKKILTVFFEILRSTVILIVILIAIYLFNLFYNHLPCIPALYLTDKRKVDITQFSEKLLNTFENNRFWVFSSEFEFNTKVHKYVYSSEWDDRYEQYSDIVQEILKFLDKNNLDGVTVFGKRKVVVYRHISITSAVDYTYSREQNFCYAIFSTDHKKTNKPVITISTQNIR